MFSHLKKQIEGLPHACGVYMFMSRQDKKTPLYIGKSVDIKKRIQSHCYQAKSQAREARLIQQSGYIDFFQTAGEMGALLLEATLVKLKRPLYNRKLRKLRNVYYMYLSEIDHEPKLSIKSKATRDFVISDNCYGLYRSQHQAKEYFLALCKEFSLCERTLDARASSSPCFPYQLGRCHGVCCAKESYSDYRRRLVEALSVQKQVSWPFAGPIKCIEHDEQHGISQSHYIDQWRYLGSTELDTSLGSSFKYGDLPRVFDRDHYKILFKYLCSFSENFKTAQDDDVISQGAQFIIEEVSTADLTKILARP
jgi:predicted GIY-YIG superfamily endonuclease